MSIKKSLITKWKRLLPLAAIILLLVTVAIPQAIPQAIRTNMLRTVSAAGIADYALTGTNDNIIFQLALDDLPATGGTLQVVSTGTIDWANGVTVTGAIDNVVIQGAGTGTLFDGDGITPIFTAGGDYWAFKDFATDASGLATGVTSNWSMTNILLDADYYAYRGSIFDGDVGDFAYLSSTELTAPTGRGTTLVVAASNASAASKAQADYVCSGSDDGVTINTAIVAAATGGTVLLTEGTFDISDTIELASEVTLLGMGYGSHLEQNVDAPIDEGIIELVGVTNAHVANLRLSAITVLDTLGNGVSFHAATYDSSITNCWLENISEQTVDISASERISVTDCFFDNGRSASRPHIQVGGISAEIIITGNHSIDAPMGIRLDGVTHAVVTNNTIENPDNNGIYISTADLCVIANNTVTTAGVAAIESGGTENIIVSNIIEDAARSGIFLSGDGHVVEANQIRNSNTSNGDYDGIRIDSDYNVVTGNNIHDSTPRQKYGIREGAGVDFNKIEGNRIEGVVTAGILRVGANTTIQFNQGHITENSGTATLLNANTSVVVAHGLDATPTVILITFTENPTNLIADWWIDTVGAANFTFNGVDPGASNLDFYWEAKAR